MHPSLTLGVRDGDFELLGSYGWSAYFDEGVFRNPGWGQVTLHVRLVLDNSESFALAAYTLPEGAGASGTYEYFFGRQLGLWLRGYCASGLLYSGSIDDFARLGGEVGLGWWSSNRFEWHFSIGGRATRYITDCQGAYDVAPAYGRENALIEILANIGVIARVRGRPTPQAIEAR